MKDSGEYDDIIGLPHYISSIRKPMSMAARAAQFAPFAALTGHDAAIRETARLTYARIEKSEDELVVLSQKFRNVLDGGYRRVELCYFRPDIRKEGGEYVREHVELKRFDEDLRQLILVDGRVISLDDIADIKPVQ